MRLREIKLEDFQGHEKESIAFSPTITTIKGKSDCGKSSILRALRWVCLNDLGGEDFIRHEADTTEVSVLIREGKEEVTVQRAKARKSASNTYKLGDAVFKSFGQAVPDDIKQALNVNEINFQSQHDAPFWFGLSAGEVSRRLNAVIDLSVIDDTLMNISQEVSVSRGRVSLTKERLESALAASFLLKEQANRVAEFSKLHKLHNAHELAIDNRGHLEGLIHDIRSLDCSRLEDVAREVASVFQLAIQLLKSRKSARTLSDALVDAERLQARSTLPPAWTEVESCYRTWIKVNEKVEQLARLATRAVEAVVCTQDTVERLKTAESQFHRQIKGQRCPLCQQPLPL